MQLDTKIVEKIEVLAEMLGYSPDKVMDEALDLYLKVEREKQLEEDFEEHKKETNLSYDEFWDDLDFD
jgi:predicted transcriptional regulator